MAAFQSHVRVYGGGFTCDYAVPFWVGIIVVSLFRLVAGASRIPVEAQRCYGIPAYFRAVGKYFPDAVLPVFFRQHFSGYRVQIRYVVIGERVTGQYSVEIDVDLSASYEHLGHFKFLNAEIDAVARLYRVT